MTDEEKLEEDIPLTVKLVKEPEKVEEMFEHSNPKATKEDMSNEEGENTDWYSQ